MSSAKSYLAPKTSDSSTTQRKLFLLFLLDICHHTSFLKIKIIWEIVFGCIEHLKNNLFSRKRFHNIKKVLDDDDVDDDDDGYDGGYDHDNESPAWPGLLGIQGYALLQVEKIQLHLPVSQWSKLIMKWNSLTMHWQYRVSPCNLYYKIKMRCCALTWVV